MAFVKGFPTEIGIYAIQIDGTSERRLTSFPIEAFDAAEWLVDGSTLIYGAGNGDEGRADLWIVGLDGRPERRIVDATDNDGGATWSPDGRWIAYLHKVGSGRTRVMVPFRRIQSPPGLRRGRLVQPLLVTRCPARASR